MQTIIAVDLDETLAETLDAVLAYHHYIIKGLPITRSDVTNYQLRSIPKYTSQGIQMEDGMKLFDECMESPGYQTCKTVSGSREKLQERKNAGYSLKILTGRPESQRVMTTTRVEKNFPHIFDEIIFANYFTSKAKSKGELCKEKGISIMIEDNLDYAENVAKYGMTSYLLAKPWNQEYHNTNPKVIKVEAWKDIIIEFPPLK